jgi:hypothetical protein
LFRFIEFNVALANATGFKQVQHFIAEARADCDLAVFGRVAGGYPGFFFQLTLCS